MNSNSPPTPEMFTMTAPLPNMNGARIRVTHGDREVAGTLVCFERPVEGLFGVRIDIVHPPVMDVGAPPASTTEWTKVGEFSVEYLCLSKGAILAIQQSNDQEFEFDLQRQ